MAAPVGGQVLSEVLPYLNLEKTETSEDEKQEVEVPNIEKMTVKEAKVALKERNLLLEIENAEDFEGIDTSEYIVQEQFPKAGIKIFEEKSIRVQTKEGKK